MGQDRVDEPTVLDAGDDPKPPAAVDAGLDVDAEDTFEAPRPAARGEPLGPDQAERQIRFADRAAGAVIRQVPFAALSDVHRLTVAALGERAAPPGSVGRAPRASDPAVLVVPGVSAR